jgi:hypothetical protein
MAHKRFVNGDHPSWAMSLGPFSISETTQLMLKCQNYNEWNYKYQVFEDTLQFCCSIPKTYVITKFLAKL